VAPAAIDELSLAVAVAVAVSCGGIQSPRHVDNFILIPGESYIPPTRIQRNGRNETGILIPDMGAPEFHHLRRLMVVSEPSCERQERESKVLIFGREILCA